MKFEIVVIGGSYAGISAALQAARARKRIAVVDAGSRRNRFASSSHGFLGFDGADPAVIAKTAREQLLAYPTVTWIDGTVSRAHVVAPAADGYGFAVHLASGTELDAKRIVLALGVSDGLPAIPGIEERWGKSVFHCPYCHGYELHQGPIACIATSPFSPHVGELLADWGPTTYFAQGIEPKAEEIAALERRGVRIERTRIAKVSGDGHLRPHHRPAAGVTPPIDAEAIALHLEDGRVLHFSGAFLAPQTRVAPLATELGCELEDGPMGPFIKTDPMKETTVRGVFACGDAAVAAGSVAISVGDGVRAGVSAHRSLIFG